MAAWNLVAIIMASIAIGMNLFVRITLIKRERKIKKALKEG